MIAKLKFGLWVASCDPRLPEALHGIPVLSVERLFCLRDQILAQRCFHKAILPGFANDESRKLAQGPVNWNQRFHRCGDAIELWTALDALVLKAVAITLNRTLEFPETCYHGPGKEEARGAKAAVRCVCSHLPKNQFVFRSDLKSAKGHAPFCAIRRRYYASINHAVLLDLVRQRIGDPVVMDLVGQYLHRTVEENCLYTTVKRGISLGRPLSPVMAAIYLEPLDRRMEETGLVYARFMDDRVVLAPTRWALRRAIVIINETLRELRVEQHPDKTSIGRIERGFTFLGYWITARGVTGVAPSAQQNFEERKARLYEQNAPPEVIRMRVELYVRRWRQWVLGGVREVMVATFPGSVCFDCVVSKPPTLHRPA